MSGLGARAPVPARLVFTTPVHLVAFAGGAGLSPWAPGTMGTLAALPFWWALAWLPWPTYAAIVLAGFGLGCWVCGRSAQLLGAPDYGGIVFDEVVGVGITAFPLLHDFGARQWPAGVAWAAAFVLFRIFDIAKPWPVRWLDRNVHGGIGIMLDDAAAGVMGGLVLGLARHLL